MQTIRRLYLYAVALVSLLTTLWGAIGLVRSFLAGEQIGGDVTRLAGALSLLLVGVPVFLIHWWLAQRDALRDPEERSDLVRALFLYGTLLATLIPVVYNTLALFSRSLTAVFGLDVSRALASADQTLADNLVAIVFNLLVAAYFYYTLRSDWQAGPLGDSYADVRRLYRYIWMVYGLVMAFLGLQHILQYMLQMWNSRGREVQALLPNGLALLLVGLPVWAFAWRTIRVSLVDPAESQSRLRLVALYLVVLFSAAGALLALGYALEQVLLLALGQSLSLFLFLFRLGEPLSFALSLGLVWIFYRRELQSAIEGLSISAAQTGQAEETPELVSNETAEEGFAGSDQEAQNQISTVQASLGRLYNYLLALAGLTATFFGLLFSLNSLIDLYLKPEAVWERALQADLASSLAALVVGLPVWFIYWRKANREATLEGEAGDHARRSLIRRGYLYLVLFVAVIGLMFSTGALLFQFISAWLGDPAPDMLAMVVQHLKNIVLLALFGLYHYLVLRKDNQLAARSLAKRHAQFPVLVLTPEDGEFGGGMVAALEHEAPSIPVAVHSITEGAPDETFSAARAVIVPAEVITKPSEALRVWLQGYNGDRLAVPTPVAGWHWVAGSGRSFSALARQAARTVRYLAEGEQPPTWRDTSAWLIILAVFGVLFALEVVFVLVVTVLEMIG